MRKLLVFPCLAVLCLQACNLGGGSSSSASGGGGSTTTSDGTTPTPAETFASDIAGTWETSCDVTADINSASAWSRTQITYSSSGTFQFITNYYSDSSCSTLLIWVYVPGNFSVGSSTSLPAGGFSVQYTTVLEQGGIYEGVYTESGAMSSYLDTVCPSSSFNTGGVSGVGGPFTCSGDSRFTTPSVGTVAYAAVVYANALSISSTAYYENLPGVLSSGSVSSSTSVDLE